MRELNVNKKTSFIKYLINEPMLICYIITRFGSMANILVTNWYIWEITKSPLIVGLTGSLTSIASFSGLFSGIIIDRFNKLKLMLISEISRTFSFLFIPIMSVYSDLSWVSLGFQLLIITLINQFYSPALRTYLLDRVKDNEIPKLNSYLFSIEQVALIIGALFAGSILIPLGFEISFLILFLIFSLSLLIVVIAFNLRKFDDKQIRKELEINSKRKLTSDFFETYKFIYQEKVLLQSTPLILFLFFSFSPFLIMLNIWSDEILNAGSYGYSLMEIFFPVGMLLGGIFSAFLTKKFSYRSIIFFCLLCAGCVTLGFSFSHILLFSLLLLAIIGMNISVANIAFVNIQSTIVPEQLRGRFFSTIQTFNGIALSIGYTASGSFSSLIGIENIFRILGLFFILSSIIFLCFRSFHGIRQTTTTNKGEKNG